MSAKPAEPTDITPFGKLAEAGLHGIVGYQLAQALAVTPPNITMWMDRLEQRGLVERERSTTDRRAQHIRATPRGASLVRRAMKSVLDSEQAALGALSAAERAMLIELLHKVARCRR
jgi:DNA-binding MarR family transcriptional regulator